MSGRVPAGWTRVPPAGTCSHPPGRAPTRRDVLPPAGTCSRPMDTCSTMWVHRPHKPRIRRLSSALPAILESRGEDLTTAAQDLPRGRRHEAMVRFTMPESPDRGTSAHPPGSRPGRWTPRPPGGHRARHAGTGPDMRAPRAAINTDPPGSSPARGRPAPAEHDQTCRAPWRGRELTSPFQDLTRATDPFQAPRPVRRRPPAGGCPEGGSRDRPSTQPRTVATERAQHGRPTVPALDLSQCLKPPWSQSVPPTKATPAPMPGVTVTEGAQPRGTVRVSGRSPVAPARSNGGPEGTRKGKDPGPQEARTEDQSCRVMAG